MPLRLLKSALFGVLATVFGLVVWVVGTLTVGLLWLLTQIPSDRGGLGAVSFGMSEAGVLLVMPACFAVGSIWMYRRLNRRAAG